MADDGGRNTKDGNGGINISRRNSGNNDIYSDSRKERASFSRSDGGDIYIGKNNKSGGSSGRDVYISSRNAHKFDTDELIIDISKSNAKSTTNAPRREDTVYDYDDFSDFDDRRKVKKTAKKKSKGKRTALAVIAVILVLAIGISAFGVSSVLGVVNKFKPAEEIVHAETETPLISEKGVTNILLIGLDKEKQGASRSDSIMIVSVNKNTGKITVTSVLRDTHLYVPGNGEAKVNASFAWGGATLLIQTLESSFGIKIDEYAAVNFDMFTALIDELGGIDIEITEREADYLNDGQDYKKSKRPDEFQSGESVHINGYQALWYSRIRYLDSDFMRTHRQRKVIAAIVSNVKSKLTPTGIFSLIKTANKVAPNIETTLSKSELISLLFDCAACLTKSDFNVENLIVSQKIPFDDTWYYFTAWDGSSIGIDLEENARLLYSSIYEPQKEEPQTEE